MNNMAPAPAVLTLRPILFLAAFGLSWISLRPFANLGAADAFDLVSGLDSLSALLFALAGLIGIALCWRSDREGLRLLVNPAYIALAVWIVLTTLTSQNISTSIKRAAAFFAVASAAATLPLLPVGRRHLAVLLAAIACVLLALSYFGVIFLPEFSIHQTTDIDEPGLAGDWRGVFGHKNSAGAVFVLVGFIGLYVARAFERTSGAAIAFAALVFVIFSQAKTATLLCLPTLAVSLFAAQCGARPWWRMAALAPFVALMMLGVGSALAPLLQDVTAKLPFDASFTGRADVWRFALTKLMAHPLTGYGFEAFWNTESQRYGVDDQASWLAAAQHAHNCLVDVALSMGLPGVVLASWAFVLQPLQDIRRAARRGADAALLTLLAQIWLFGLYLSTLESYFFHRSDPIWFTFLFAVFGLRYLAVFPTSPR
jgi:O-antigen ligase